LVQFKSNGQARRRTAIMLGKRNDILAACLALFRVKGFRGTTVKLISVKADVSTATIYKHYANKEALFGACIESLQKTMEDGKIDNSEVIGFFEDVALADLGQIDISAFHKKGAALLMAFASGEIE